MWPIARPRNMDAQTWSTATWVAPFMAQVVLGAMFVNLWLLGKTKYFIHSHERAWLLTASVVTVVASVPVTGLLLTSRSSRVRGVAVSVAGSSIIVLVGAVIYSFWLLRW